MSGINPRTRLFPLINVLPSNLAEGTEQKARRFDLWSFRIAATTSAWLLRSFPLTFCCGPSAPVSTQDNSAASLSLSFSLPLFSLATLNLVFSLSLCCVLSENLPDFHWKCAGSRWLPKAIREPILVFFSLWKWDGPVSKVKHELINPSFRFILTSYTEGMTDGEVRTHDA